MKRLYPILLALLFFLGCDKFPFIYQKDDLRFSLDGNPALVVVLENNENIDFYTTRAFYFYQDEILQIFSDLFDVPAETMQDLSLEEIIDIYGEPWQIQQIVNVAAEHYEQIVVLTDEEASLAKFVQTLKNLYEQSYDIDVLFNLHGDSDLVYFNNELTDITTLIAAIQAQEIKIRSLYQTCCYGSGMIDDWEELGVIAISGVNETNSFAMFSPFYFLENWLNGMSFSEATKNACQREIATILSYAEIIPELADFYTEEDIEDSQSFFGGIKPELLWEHFPVW